MEDVEVAVEDLRKRVDRETDPMVGDPVLFVVVGPDLLGAFARSHLRAPHRRTLARLLGQLLLVEACPQHPHRLEFVLQLGLLVLTGHDDAGRAVSDPDGRVRRVDRLAAGPGRPEGLDVQIVVVDLDLDRFDFGEHGHRRHRCVHPPLRLGLGHTLHAMRTGFELEPGVRALPFDGERRFLQTAGVRRRDVDRFDGPTVAFGEALVHAVHVAGPQRRLVTAGGRPDLDDDVLVVVHVLGEQEAAEFGFDLLDLGLFRGDDAGEVLDHLRIVLDAEHLGGLGGLRLRFTVAAERVDDRLQLGVAFGDLPVALLIGEHARFGEQGQDRLELLVGGRQAFGEPVIHRRIRRRRTRRRAPLRRPDRVA